MQPAAIFGVRMTRRSWIQFFALAALWGASYLFIKVALEDVSPAMVVFVRTALAVAGAAALRRCGRSARRGLRGQLGTRSFCSPCSRWRRPSC